MTFGKVISEEVNAEGIIRILKRTLLFKTKLQLLPVIVFQ
jgi:hypothetical protein